MSVKEEKTEQLEKGIVVDNRVETTGLVEVEQESKIEKAKEIAKKIGKVLAIALVGGVLGYLAGSNSSRQDEECYDDEPEYIEAEIVESDVE